MRVIAGKYKSRIIKMPKGAKIRPTKDRIREALFSIIGPSIHGAAVLDAFAGSGAFGIEALSRGAGGAVFIDNNNQCIRAIKNNLGILQIHKSNFTIIKMDTLRAFDVLGRKNEKFDIILLDPPYYKDMAKKSLIKLEGHVILSPLCIIIVEHHKDDILPKELNLITSYRVVRYGDIHLSFYRVKSKGNKHEKDRSICRKL